MSIMHNPAHPREVLREYLPEGVSIGEVAKRQDSKPFDPSESGGRRGLGRPLRTHVPIDRPIEGRLKAIIVLGVLLPGLAFAADDEAAVHDVVREF